jgi:putative peptidoglycan lipid II flippase
MAGLMTLSGPIIEVLLQRGEFTAHAAAETSYALIFYSSGLWAFVGTRIVASTFYSMQDTKTPVKIAVLSVLTNIIFSFVLMGPLRQGGLAFANAIASAVNFIVLFYLLRKKLGKVDGREIIRSFIKTGAASAFMGSAAFFSLKMFPWNDGTAFFQKVLILSGVIILCAGIFLLIMHLMKSEELRYLIRMRKRKE